MLLLSSSCASADYRRGSADVFQCSDGSELTVQFQRRTATVLAGGHSYVLVRKSSNLGERFASPEATLIIDGDFAAFVADDLHGLQGCRSRSKF